MAVSGLWGRRVDERHLLGMHVWDKDGKLEFIDPNLQK
jgi:hypothetical protein